MKFYLIENKRIDLKAPYNENKHISVATSIINHPDNNDSPKELSNFNKFKRVFEQKYGNLQENSLLAIDFLNCTNPSSTQAWTISIAGDILKAIHHVLCCGSESEVLEIKLKTQITDLYGNVIPQALISLTDFCPDFDLDDDKVCLTKYTYANVKIPVVDSRRYSTQNWQMWVEIEKQNFICIADIIPPFSETNRKILEDEKFCDFQILTKDINGDLNEPICCHKIFLCANSPVFTRMLGGSLREAIENKMKMEEISFCGVQALLKFLYYSDVTDALESSGIALELLKAAHKYDIQVLWKVICVILMEEPHAWYNVDMAFSLFEFLRNRERNEDNQKLLKKVIQVLALKSEELPTSKLYSEIFTSPIARDMFHLALATNKP